MLTAAMLCHVTCVQSQLS